MGRKSTVEKLPDDRFDFLIGAILNGWTDREISSQFEAKYGEKLPKSSLNTWRKKAGNELAERYRFKRFQVRSFVEQMKDEGFEIHDDKYKNIIEGLEDHLLTAERDLLAQNPAKLLLARQREENFRLKQQQIDLNRDRLDFEKKKHEQEAAVRVDRLAIGAEVWKFILYWCNKNEPHLADGLTRNSTAILEGLEGHIENAEAA